MTEYSEEENEVINIHNLFWDALANRDINLRFSFCSEDITFFGSGLHERATNKTEYKKINEEGVLQYPHPFQIRFLWTYATVLNTVAWVESEVEWVQNIDNKIYKELVRSTTILKYENAQWLIVHVHGSSPDYRFIDGGYMSTEGTVKRNKELERQVFERTEQLNKSLEDLKAAQAQLIQAEKMASLGELTAGIAHEIQNPLNFVNNFSEVNEELIEEMIDEIKKGNTKEAEVIASHIKQNLEKINHHGKRADAIVKGMLQHSKSSSSAVKEPTDINKLADEYLRLAYHGLRAKDKSFNATLKTDFDESIGKINIIPQDIGRVILNLITNAFYAAPLPPEGGFPDPPYKHEPTIWLSTKKVGDKVLITVRDNGPGISPKILDKIFQPFFTTKPTGQGTGLGLSLSYDIVNTHGGLLKVETIENVGSEFIIQIPIS